MPVPMVTAVVPAAGVGSRFGTERNKPFFMLGGKPLVLWCLQCLEQVHEIGQAIPVFKMEDAEAGRLLLKENGLKKSGIAATGGPHRQDSVFNGLRLANPGTDIAVIHDGARPLVTPELFIRAIAAVKDGADCAVIAVPVKDTIKETDKDGNVIRTPNRESLWAVQTPQAFRFSTLMQAMEKAAAEGFYSTDEAALVERYGGRVVVVMGSYDNIKVTGPEDIEMAEMLLRKRQAI